jgi:hypothetical protein
MKRKRTIFKRKTYLGDVTSLMGLFYAIFWIQYKMYGKVGYSVFWRYSAETKTKISGEN